MREDRVENLLAAVLERGRIGELGECGIIAIVFDADLSEEAVALCELGAFGEAAIRVAESGKQRRNVRNSQDFTFQKTVQLGKESDPD